MSTVQELPRLLSLQQLAKRLGVNGKTILRMMDDGNFPRPIRVGKQRMAWPERQLVEWMESRQT